MQSLGFKQSHVLTDVRLALGFTACLIAGVTFYYDYQLGFEKTKHYTVYAVAAYFIINSILTLWIWGVEGRCVYVGSKGGVKVRSHNPMFGGGGVGSGSVDRTSTRPARAWKRSAQYANVGTRSPCLHAPKNTSPNTRSRSRPQKGTRWRSQRSRTRSPGGLTSRASLYRSRSTLSWRTRSRSWRSTPLRLVRRRRSDEGWEVRLVMSEKMVAVLE